MDTGSRFLRRVSFVLIVGALLLTQLGVPPAFALGTPQIVSVNPSSGSSVGSNVCIRVRIDWDSEYRAMRIRFGSEGWQESSEVEFERCFGTGHLSAGWYTIRVEADRQGGNWSSPAVAETSYELRSSAPPPPPPPTSAPVPYGPAISEVRFNPSGGVQVGNSVSVYIRVDSSNPGAISITPSCGNTQHAEHTVPEFTTTWYTQGCNAGNQSIRVCARHVNDPNWAYASCVDRSYSLSAPPQSVPAPTANFWADSTSIGRGQCTWLRWETANADRVDIDGTVVNRSGSRQVCPSVTTRYSLKATGSGGEATRSLTIQVSAAPPPAQPTSPPPPPPASGGSGSVATSTPLPAGPAAPSQPGGVRIAGTQVCRVNPVEISTRSVLEWDPVRIFGITLRIRPVIREYIYAYLNVRYNPEPTQWYHVWFGALDHRVTSATSPNCGDAVVCFDGQDNRGYWRYRFSDRVYNYILWNMTQDWSAKFTPPQGETCP